MLCFTTVIAILFDNVKRRTNHPAGSTYSNDAGKDNTPNYNISCTASPQSLIVSKKNTSDKDMTAIFNNQESELSCFAINYQGSAGPKNSSDNDILLLSSKHLQESDLATNDFFMMEPQQMSSVVYTLPATTVASSLQPSTMMEEAKCSSDVGTIEKNEEVTYITEGIMQADMDFEEVISHDQDKKDDLTGEFGVFDLRYLLYWYKGDVPVVALIDSGMGTTLDNTELVGYFSGNMSDKSITQYESMAEFETFYGQVSQSILVYFIHLMFIGFV